MHPRDRRLRRGNRVQVPVQRVDAHQAHAVRFDAAPNHVGEFTRRGDTRIDLFDNQIA